MALQYQIKQGRPTAGALQSFAPRAINQGAVITYNVLVSDNANPNLPAEDVIDNHVAEQNGLPCVNESIFEWYDGQQTKIVPWLICSNKRVVRNEQQKLLFHVVCEFSIGNRFSLDESELKLIDVPNQLSAWPYIRESVWSEESKVIYKEAVSGGPQELRLPVGTLYSEPFKRRHAVRSIRQTQFEFFADVADVHQKIEDRMFTVQDRTYAGYVGDPPRWMITNIDYQKVKLPEAGTSSKREAWMMTYMVEKTTRDGGWYDRRALVAKHFRRQPGGAIEAFRDPVDGATIIDCLIKADGTLKGDGLAGEPDFINYRVQPEGFWDFMRNN